MRRNRLAASPAGIVMLVVLTLFLHLSGAVDKSRQAAGKAVAPTTLAPRTKAMAAPSTRAAAAPLSGPVDRSMSPGTAGSSSDADALAADCMFFGEHDALLFLGLPVNQHEMTADRHQAEVARCRGADERSKMARLDG